MATVRDFYSALPDAVKDLFVSVANDMQTSAPNDKIERLRLFLSQLKAEIDQINRRRQALGTQLNNVEYLLRELDKFMADGGDFELQLFKGSLNALANELKGEIAALKPDNKLQKKFDVARRIEALLHRQRTAAHLIDGIVKPCTPSKTGAKPIVATVTDRKEPKAAAKETVVPESEELLEDIETEKAGA